ncbi:unnamed protein product [Arabidopsis arenosa]|uniref:Protein kinase domain-containing protein n=1 Tax=Arabidopsis arenosa TaxID=38785 RepID=A0A8S2B0Z4_ARAAE|nr:unnamed protein product [Arabidopsis arenosa]
MFSPLLFRFSKPNSCLVFLLFLSYFHHLPCALSQREPSCDTLFRCGNLTAGFPFWGVARPQPCGHPSLGLQCQKQSNSTSLIISGLMYRVLEVNITTSTLKLVRQDFSGPFCSASFSGATLPPDLFELFPDYKTLPAYYLCDPRIHYPANFTCSNKGVGSMNHDDLYHNHCGGNFNITVPIGYAPEEEGLNVTNLESVLKKGFEVKLNIDERPCQEYHYSGKVSSLDSPLLSAWQSSFQPPQSTIVLEPAVSNNLEQDEGPSVVRGRGTGCTADLDSVPIGNSLSPPSTPQTAQAHDSPSPSAASDTLSQQSTEDSVSQEDEILQSPQPEAPHNLMDLLSLCSSPGIGHACGFMGATLITGCLLCFMIRKRRTSYHPRHQNLKGLVEMKQYSYAEVRKITKSFSHTVGKGGFGTVYGGYLFDGRKVAVKILKDDFKSNGEDFINEIKSMSQTSHINIVSLLGFCYEGSRRAIMYEFLENGSLDQFISKKSSLNLDVNTLYRIALGVARGLDYLHHGCRTRIVHFDIKPQNVLLDENLCPKVSDFGLAKLCEKRESILSLIGARGTIGYIAPEVFSGMYGSVSHKSDVYSYGMLVLEMIGVKNKETEETAASNSSSAYFQDWIYKNLENEEHTWKFGAEITREEKEIAKKMTLVGLWCIQPCPLNRPPMNRVVEMMEGSLDALEVPPKPSLQYYPEPLRESSSLSEENSNYYEVFVGSAS